MPTSGYNKVTVTTVSHCWGTMDHMAQVLLCHWLVIDQHKHDETAVTYLTIMRGQLGQPTMRHPWRKLHTLNYEMVGTPELE